jgi:hypothetical protein
MLEKLKNIVSSLTLDNVVQGLLFLLLLVSVYWFIPGITLFLAPFAIIGIGVQSVYNLFFNKKNLSVV